MNPLDGIPIAAAFIAVFGAGLVTYYKWSYDDILSRENILKGFKYEIEILHERINRLVDGDNPSWLKPLYNKGGLFYEYNGSLSRFKESIAKGLINYYSNIDLSEYLMRNNPDDAKKNIIVNLLKDSQIMESTILGNINSELNSIDTNKQNTKFFLIIGIGLIVIGIILFFITPTLLSNNTQLDICRCKQLLFK